LRKTKRSAEKAAAEGAVFELNEKAKDEWKNWAPSIALHLPGQAPPTMAASQSKIELK